jgi:hypothetical protein
MLRTLLPIASFIFLSAMSVVAQTPRPGDRLPEPKTGEVRPRDHDQEVSLPEEMRVKMAIARAESDHKKVLEDVEKMSDLCGEIAKGFAEHKQLSVDDMKKLGTIEKLAKHVLNSAGGEEIDDKSAADHMQTSEAINKLNAAAETIKKDMKAETRFVVSATVIANSNQVIHLSRYIRRAPKVD